MKSAAQSWMAIAVAASLMSTILLFVLPAHAAEAATATQPIALDASVARWAYVAAAVATGLSSLAAAFAVARVGSAAIGALAEKPELFGRLVVLVGLAEGIAIYGLIISILILNQLR